MKGITTAALLPDSYFNAPVYLDEGFLLVAPDIPITRELLSRLEKWRFTEVFSDGGPVDSPSYMSQASGVSKVTSLDEDIKERQRIEETHAFYVELLEFAGSFYKAFQEQNTLNTARLMEMLKRAIATVKSNRSAILRFDDAEISADGYMAVYSVNTALLAVAMGDFLKLPPHKLLELALAAFLHDLGMTKVSPSILASGKALTPEEKKTMMYHTVVGYKLLRAYSLSEDVALAALEHHERTDGSGYPRRIPPDKMSQYGRIIAVACSYVAATSRRRYKASRDGHSAIREMLAKKQYDPSAVKALLYTLSLFPLGSYVLLSSQAQGVVVDTNPSAPRLPLVRMLLDPEGNPVTKGALVQTSEEGGITVVRPLARQEAERLKAKIGK